MLDAVFSDPSAVTGAILLAAFVGYITWRNNFKTRQANAASAFRTSVLNAFSCIPEESKHWNSEVIASIQSELSSLTIAVATFSPFLNPLTRNVFLKDWQVMKEHCVTVVPLALSPAEKMYGGGPNVALEAKRDFHVHVRNILSFAQHV